LHTSAITRPERLLGGRLTPLDVRIANDVLAFQIGELRPTAVVFISRLAARMCDDSTTRDLPRVATPHPTSQWWNRTSKAYGDLRGRDVLDGFVRGVWGQRPQ